MGSSELEPLCEVTVFNLSKCSSWVKAPLEECLWMTHVLISVGGFLGICAQWLLVLWSTNNHRQTHCHTICGGCILLLYNYFICVFGNYKISVRYTDFAKMSLE